MIKLSALAAILAGVLLATLANPSLVEEKRDIRLILVRS